MRRTPLFVAALLPVLASFAGANPLAEAPSAFVRAHANSPVQWLPWGDDAFARAKAENKPLYLVVGSFTQELARAMREQSFAREENAALLNAHFVCVVADRDEQPGLTAFLQAYLATVKQMQGWPLNVWLTPELKPFEGATYLPPSDEWGKEGLPNALRRVRDAWQADPEAQRAKADEALAALAAAVRGPSPAVDAGAVTSVLAEGEAAWLATFDAVNGGFGEAPRRPEPELLRFLLQREGPARAAALATLRAIATSPVRDPLDGGFFRSAGDTAWRQPTLQKTLADQARLALAYLETGDSELASAGRGALGYCLRALGSPGSGLIAAEDGTPETVVPSFLWTTAEVRDALGSAATDDLYAALGLAEAGNLPPDAFLGVDSAGKNLPRLVSMRADEAALAKLRAVRAARPRPARDSLATSGAHGLVLAALARIDDPDTRAAAAELAGFIRRGLILPDGGLRAVPGGAMGALPRDYAAVIDGLMTFAAAAKDEPARAAALALLARVDGLFWDAATGRYFAVTAEPEAGVGVRVYGTAPDAGDAPTAECAMLLTLVAHGLGDDARRAAIAASIAADVRDGATPARGDQLLALQAFAGGRVRTK